MKNKKGFTLIELLAVIIVLALILVFAIPAVLDTSNNAQKKAFQVYAKRALTNAQEFIEGKKVMGDTLPKVFDESTSGFNLGDNGDYSVCVVYTAATSTKADSYKLYITNGKYCYQGKTSNQLDTTDTNLKACVGETKDEYVINEAGTGCVLQ